MRDFWRWFCDRFYNSTCDWSNHLLIHRSHSVSTKQSSAWNNQISKKWNDISLNRITFRASWRTILIESCTKYLPFTKTTNHLHMFIFLTMALKVKKTTYVCKQLSVFKLYLPLLPFTLLPLLYTIFHWSSIRKPADSNLNNTGETNYKHL